MEEKTFRLRIITPDRDFFSGEVEMLTVNAIDGERGIMRHTLPFVTAIKAGVLRIKQRGRDMEAINSDGIVTVSGGEVTVLTLSCEWPYEVDEERTRMEILELRDKERNSKSVYEYKMAKAQLAAQFAKLKLGNKRN